MKNYRGVIRKNPVEGGVWELVCEDGEHYQLAGGDDALRQEGAHVEVRGAVDKGAFGLGMTGPTLAIKSYKRI